jgi:hypothetical protein
MDIMEDNIYLLRVIQALEQLSQHEVHVVWEPTSHGSDEGFCLSQGLTVFSSLIKTRQTYYAITFRGLWYLFLHKKGLL